MESHRPITNRDREMLALPDGDYDAVQVSFSRLVGANEYVERVTQSTGWLPLAEARLYLQRSPDIIQEPELTRMLIEMEQRGIDAPTFIEFVGNTAVRRQR